jgi:uncharacterized FAD-dependent dehydrogenase
VSRRTSPACIWAICDSTAAYAIAAIREALPGLRPADQGLRWHDAVLTGVETRTSSPLRITRGEVTRA